ncbi:hypothetical protein AK812_SmicGene21506 [Symbiodinium microadriaticum]|uniref:Uncharacterized protein n=1 Tax=Symbiodinium microadriaticum TaxID=2951 RepID=A0A1Q9DMA9_SYMMI|nr:hypothetical protein AK812_SmicGene21506 [Symbiodinium microadriaticum]
MAVPAKNDRSIVLASVLTRRARRCQAGPSIMGGAVTTIAGTAFLLPCRMILFQKLGWTLFANSIVSVFFTFTFLTPLFIILGPTGTTGTLFCFPCLRRFAPDENHPSRRHGGGGLHDAAAFPDSPRGIDEEAPNIPETILEEEDVTPYSGVAPLPTSSEHPTDAMEEHMYNGQRPEYQSATRWSRVAPQSVPTSSRPQISRKSGLAREAFFRLWHKDQGAQRTSPESLHLNTTSLGWLCRASGAGSPPPGVFRLLRLALSCCEAAADVGPAKADPMASIPLGFLEEIASGIDGYEGLVAAEALEALLAVPPATVWGMARRMAWD